MTVLMRRSTMVAPWLGRLADIYLAGIALDFHHLADRY
jgi:hypothetical protein